MKVVAMSSSEQIQTEKALQSLATMPVAELPTLVSDLGKNPAGNVGHFENVTDEFMATKPVMGPVLETSNFQIYKGVLKRLAGMHSTSSGCSNNQIAVIAGKDSTVSDVIYGESVDDILNTPEVLMRWQDLGNDVLGLVVWDSVDDPRKFHDSLLGLPRLVDPLLLLAFNGLPHPNAWHVHIAGEGADERIDFLPVILDSKAGTRKKDDKFSITEASKVGTCFADQAGVAPFLPNAVAGVLHAVHSNIVKHNTIETAYSMCIIEQVLLRRSWRKIVC